MIMVVFLHSYNIDIKQGGKVLIFDKDANWFFQNFISYGLTRIAVPLFFLISGYLFINKSEFNFQVYKTKINKRFKTLVIPYLFWALFGLFIYFTLQSIPQSQGFFTKKLIKDYSFWEWINAIVNEPIPYQLWFLKDLIVMVFLSPLLYVILKKTKFLLPLFVFPFWTFNQDTIFLTSESLLFFSLGIYIQLFNKEFIEIKIQKLRILIFTWLVLITLKTMLGYLSYSTFIQNILLKVSILIGIIAFWNLLSSKIFINHFEKQINKLVGFSFFIYVFHEPFLTILKKAMFSVMSKTPFSYLIIYLLAPLIIISISVFIAIFLKQKLYFIYKIITGNR